MSVNNFSPPLILLDLHVLQNFSNNEEKSANIRDEFNFSDIHQSKNAMCPVQLTWRSSGVTLHEAHCVHTSMHVGIS